MTGVILSGGENTRMGRNKAFLVIDGERLIDRILGVFKNLFDEVLLVTNQPLDYLDLDVTLVTDIFPGKKALGGIYTGLFYAGSPQVFVAACDMPCLNPRFIAYMMAQADAYDVVVPETQEGLQPLHAIYGKRCLPNMKHLISRDKLKVAGFYKGLKCLTIPEKTIKTFDAAGSMFINVNTQAEFDLLTSA